MFRWGLSQDIVETDPTAGLKAYDPGTPRDRVLNAKEVGVVWKWFDSGMLSWEAADILKLELLTGARCGEISGLCAEEVDRCDWIWRLPAARSKNKKPRATPLLGTARRIIEVRLSTIQVGPLFTAKTGSALTSAHIGHYLLSRQDKLPIEKFTTHDLRRTVATMLAEMGFALDLVAAIVGHESGGTETRTLIRHYVRTDLLERKAHVLRAWDNRLHEIVADRNLSTGSCRLLRVG
jgi:integrase